MLEVVSRSSDLIRIAIVGAYTPIDGKKVLDLLEECAGQSKPPSRYHFDLGRMTEFGLGYADVMDQAKRIMRLRFNERVLFCIYTSSAVTRNFGKVFSGLVDRGKLELVVSDDPNVIERALRH